MSTAFGPFLKFEGTTDLLLTGVPVGIVTFQASGSITSGNAVILDSLGRVMVDNSAPASIAFSKFAGVALKSAADGDKIGVIVFGALKNLVAGATVTYGDKLVLAQRGQFGVTGSATSNLGVGKAYSAASSGSTFLGFVVGI